MKNAEKQFPLIDSLPLTQRCIFNKFYTILLEDTVPPMFNINMQTFHCFAISTAEAIGRMCIERADLKNREIISVTFN